MKIYIYMAVLLAFIMIFQQNPVAGVIMVAIVAAGYYFFKARKKNGRGMGMRGGFFGSPGSVFQGEQSNLLLQMMMLEKLGNNSGRSIESEIDEAKRLRDMRIEERKQMVLSYFGDE